MKKHQIYNELYSKGLPHEDRIAKVKNCLEGRQFESFLDIGCGDGSLTVFLAQLIKAKTVKGVELAEQWDL